MIDQVVETIRADIESKIDWLDKRLKDGLSDLVAAVLVEPTSNTHVLAEALPRGIRKPEHRYQYIRRFLKQPKIKHRIIMIPYVKELVKHASQNNQTIIIQMDQSKIVDGFEVLMISIKVKDRAMPIAWAVRKTEGNIGFEVQESLLNHVYEMLPKNKEIVLMADRFYGTKMLVEWCQNHNYGYRIRLKGNLLFQHENSIISVQDANRMGMTKIVGATFNQSNVTTNIGILHEQGHPEPWFIAMDCEPNKYRILDYGSRWGIEPMFSDFKSRGFGITKSQLKHADRLERLILILTLALYWSVSMGMTAIVQNQKMSHTSSKKKEKISFIPFYKRDKVFSTPSFA